MVGIKAAELDMERPAIDTSFPIGWFLDVRSWEAHRSFYRQWCRPMEPGEYSHLLRQIRNGVGTHLLGTVWRLTLPSGAPIVVSGKGHRLFRVLHANWTPPARATPRPTAVEPAVPQAATRPAPPPPAPMPVPPPPPLPPAATRLRLGAPAASDLLATRLRRWG